jgi:hypothetical protein
MLKLGAYRHRVFVSRRIQGRLIARVGLYWVLYHVALWHGVLLYRWMQTQVSGAAGSVPGLFEDQVRQMAIDFLPVLVCGLLALPIVLIDMLHVSHRIAGPLVHFRSVLRELMEGKKVDRVTLRRGDLLTEFQDDFNQYLATLNHRSSAASLPAAEGPFPARRPTHSAGEVADLSTTVSPVTVRHFQTGEVPPVSGPAVWSN